MDLLDNVKNQLESLLEHANISINYINQDVYAIRESKIEAIAAVRGLHNVFVTSARIPDGRKYVFTEADGTVTLVVTVRWHAPDSGAPNTSVSKYVPTAQIDIKVINNSTHDFYKIFLEADYANSKVYWNYNNAVKWTHIPLIRDMSPKDTTAKDSKDDTDDSADTEATTNPSHPCGGKDFSGKNSDLMTKEGVIQMTVSLNDLLDKAYSYNEGNSDDICTECELQAVLANFNTLAACSDPDPDAEFAFKQTVIILCIYGVTDKVSSINIVSESLKNIYDEVAGDF